MKITMTNINYNQLVENQKTQKKKPVTNSISFGIPRRVQPSRKCKQKFEQQTQKFVSEAISNMNKFLAKKSEKRPIYDVQDVEQASVKSKRTKAEEHTTATSVQSQNVTKKYYDKDKNFITLVNPKYDPKTGMLMSCNEKIIKCKPNSKKVEYVCIKNVKFDSVGNIVDYDKKTFSYKDHLQKLLYKTIEICHSDNQNKHNSVKILTYEFADNPSNIQEIMYENPQIDSKGNIFDYDKKKSSYKNHPKNLKYEIIESLRADEQSGSNFYKRQTFVYDNIESQCVLEDIREKPDYNPEKKLTTYENQLMIFNENNPGKIKQLALQKPKYDTDSGELKSAQKIETTYFSGIKITQFNVSGSFVDSDSELLSYEIPNKKSPVILSYDNKALGGNYYKSKFTISNYEMPDDSQESNNKFQSNMKITKLSYEPTNRILKNGYIKTTIFPSFIIFKTTKSDGTTTLHVQDTNDLINRREPVEFKRETIEKLEPHKQKTYFEYCLNIKNYIDDFLFEKPSLNDTLSKKFGIRGNRQGIIPTNTEEVSENKPKDEAKELIKTALEAFIEDWSF